MRGQDCSLAAGPVREVDLLLFNIDRLLVCDPEMSRIQHGAVAIEGGRIAAAGPSAELSAHYRGRVETDLSGYLVMPGLVNTHTHAAMSLFRGVGDDLPLDRWLTDVIFPLESTFINPDSVYLGTLLSAVEMLKSGTTCFCDGYFFEESASVAALEAGIRGVMGQGVLDFPTPDLADPTKFLSRAENFLSNFPGGSDRVRPSLFCHSPYTCSPETLTHVKDLCRSNGLLFQTHVSETAGEVDGILKTYGKRPGTLLGDLGILDERTICAHAIWLSDEEIAMFAGSGASISHCPESAMKLGSGIAAVPDMISQGVRVGLGTDGCASNNDLDLLSELDFAAKIHKVFRKDPLACPAGQVIGMATLGGAAALGLDREIGSIEPGKKADLIALSLNQPHMMPMYDPAAQIVYSARGSDVRFVWVDGREVVRDGCVLSVDEADIISRAKRMGLEIMNRVR